MPTFRKARREEREKRERQDRLNAELNSDPSQREGLAKMTEFDHGYANHYYVYVVRDSDGAGRYVPREPWMSIGDWLHWPEEHEETSYARQMRDERERLSRRVAEISAEYDAVC